MGRIVPISEARSRLGDVIAEAEDREVYVLRHGRPAGVILSAEKYERLLNYVEDLEDSMSVHEAGDSVPFVPKYAAQRV